MSIVPDLSLGNLHHSVLTDSLLLSSNLSRRAQPLGFCILRDVDATRRLHKQARYGVPNGDWLPRNRRL